MSKEDITQDEIMDLFSPSDRRILTQYTKNMCLKKAETIQAELLNWKHEYEGDESKLRSLNEIEGVSTGRRMATSCRVV